MTRKTNAEALRNFVRRERERRWREKWEEEHTEERLLSRYAAMVDQVFIEADPWMQRYLSQQVVMLMKWHRVTILQGGFR